MVLLIRTIPESILTEPCESFIFSFSSEIKALIANMIETMHYNNGVGLAAPQIGVSKRIAIIDIQDGSGVKILLDPEIIQEYGSSIEEEGCLSIPNEVGQVLRPASIIVKFRTLNGAELTMRAKGLLARVICHEVDHLNGILFTSKIV